ncbi:MAG: hypothetical protein U0271_03480 [Polyangiaceae bacterium]
MRALLACSLGTSTLVLLTANAFAQDGGPQWDKTIRVESDMRFRVEDKTIGNQYTQQTLGAGVERNQNILSTKLGVSWENFKAVAQADLVLFGYQSEIQGLDGLSDEDQLQPYRFDVNELYVQVKDLFVKGFDVRLGQQIVSWGVADQFNPTNNLNSDDLIDPLLFGKQQGNFMLRGDFWVTDDFSIQGVLVPLFKPARLPLSAQLGIYAIDRLPFKDTALRYRIGTERTAALELADSPTVVDKVTIQMPETSFENMQAGFKIGGTVLEQDWSLSYYNGRTDFPVPLKNHTRQSTTPLCNDETGKCSTGALLTDVTLHYPKMHVYGLNLAGEIPLKKINSDIGGIGYRFEGALVVPQRVEMELTNDDISLAGFQIPAGEYDYDADNRPGGKRPVVVEDQPFFKWTLGFDYTFPAPKASTYINVMWVHGLVDEYGAGDWIFPGQVVRESKTVGDTVQIVQCALARDGSGCAKEVLRSSIGDYLVLGVDIHFFDEQALARLFTIWEMTGYEESTVINGQRVTKSMPWFSEGGFSAVIYPEFSYNFGNGLDLALGALIQLGKTYTKFGDPAAGGSVTYLRAKYTL